MGHFSHTCKLTGLPITGGTPVVLFPILPSDNEYDNSLDKLKVIGTTYQCSNDGTHIKFTPCWFPIEGDYDEYGGLENIIEDDNTKVLEDYYGLTIQQIVNVLTSGRKDDGYDQKSLGVIMNPDVKYEYGKPVYLERYTELIKISGMWIHREVYDNLVNSPTGDYFDKLDLGIPAILESLGFVEIEKHKTEKRYNRQFKLGKLIILSDGTWINVPKQHIYNFVELQTYCNSKGVDINISKHVNQDRSEQVFDYIIPKLNLKPIYTKHEIDKLIEDAGDDKNKLKKIYAIYQTMSNPMSSSTEQLAYRLFLNKDMYELTNQLTTPYLKAAQNGKLKKNLVELWRFDRYMFATGVYYFPVGTAPQDGEHKLVQRVLNVANDIINKRVADIYED